MKLSYPMTQMLKRLLNGPINKSFLNPTLNALKNRGLVKEKWLSNTYESRWMLTPEGRKYANLI